MGASAELAIDFKKITPRTTETEALDATTGLNVLHLRHISGHRVWITAHAGKMCTLQCDKGRLELERSGA